jgi:hypothetical protein
VTKIGVAIDEAVEMMQQPLSACMVSSPFIASADAVQGSGHSFSGQDADLGTSIPDGTPAIQNVCYNLNSVLPPLSDVTPEASKICTKLIPSLEEVVAFGGISDPAVSGIRSSKRISKQSDGDATQLERAMMNKQARQDYTNAGMIPKKLSLLSFSDSEIVDKANRIGISLGKSLNEVKSSVKGLKALEEERIITLLQKNNINSSQMDEGPSSLIMSKVSTLCEDLVDEEENQDVLDDQLDLPMPIIKERKTRQRKVYDSSNVRRSKRKITKKQLS